MRLLKIGAIVLAVFFLLGIGINYWASQKIRKELEKVGLVSSTDLSVNVLTKRLTIKGLQLEKDMPSKTDTVQILKVNIMEVELLGCEYLNFILNDELCLGEISLKTPVVKIIEDIKKNNAVTKDRTSQQSDRKLKSLTVKDIILKAGSLVATKESQEWLSIDTIFTHLSGLSVNLESDSSAVNWQAIESDFKSIQVNQTTSKNKLLIAHTQLDSKKKNCIIKKLQWQPKQSKADFTKDLKYRKARLNVGINQIEMMQLDIRKLLLKKILRTKKVAIEALDFEVYTDKNVPICEYCYKPYLHEMFQKSPIKIAIDSVVVKDNSRLMYEQVSKGMDVIGELRFEQLYASIYNLKHEKEAMTSIDIQSNFMDESMVKVHFDFWLNAPNQDYAFEGEVNQFTLGQMNPFLAYTTNARIQKGEVKELIFNGKGDQYAASGEMQFNYKNLEIALLNKDKKRKKILSKIVNTLLVAKENPDGKKFHEGKMYFERVTHKSFISNWWKTIQSGFQSTMFPDILLREELKKD